MAERPVYNTEGGSIVDALLEREGVSRAEFLQLPREERQKIIGELRAILAPAVADKKEAGLDLADAQKLRDGLGLEKWVELRQIVSYVRTSIATILPEERKERFAQDFRHGVDLNEMRHLLSEVYDVRPSRIETDVRHQSGKYYRAVVELVSNALDASTQRRSPIGRFGVGFYQILNHLRGADDRVIVTTKTAEMPRAARIEFRSVDGRIDVQIHEDMSMENGTTIELRSEAFESGPAKDILRSYFTHTQDIRLEMNGEVIDHWHPDNPDVHDVEAPLVRVQSEDGRFIVRDDGAGMSVPVIFEKLLVPKLSSKPSVHQMRETLSLEPRLHYEIGNPNNGRGDVVVQVGGILVERLQAKGVNIARTLVLDLPPSTILGEERDEVNVDRQSVAALKALADRAVLFPRPACFQIINALAAACASFQKRSRLSGQDDNLLRYLRERVRGTFPDMSFVPNTADFLALDLPEDRVALLDPAVAQTPLGAVPGLTAEPLFAGRQENVCFRARFRPDAGVAYVRTQAAFIFDERIDVPPNASVLNHVLGLAGLYGIGSFVAEKPVIARPAARESAEEERTLLAFAELHWNELYFANPAAAHLQAEDLTLLAPELAASFTERVLRRLPPGARMEGWDILEWLARDASRSRDEKEAIIDGLAGTLDALLADPLVAATLRAYPVALYSLFEREEAALPPHLRGHRPGLKGRTVVEGKEYFVEEDTQNRSQWIRFIAADGSYAQYGGPENLLFRNRDVSVYSDHVERADTKERLEERPDIYAPWGYIGAFPHVSEKRLSPLLPKSARSQPPSSVRRADARPRSRAVVGGITFTVSGGELLRDGERVRMPKLSVPVREVFVGPKGLRVLAYFGDDIDARQWSDALLILDEHGEVVTEYTGDEFGPKMELAEGFEKGRANRRDVDWSKSARYVAVGREVAAARDVVLQVVRYRMDNDRYRHVVGYIKADGSYIPVNEYDRVDGLSLAVRYGTAASCGCCNLNDPFILGRMKPDPFEPPETLPVTITTPFWFDEARGRWCALASTGEYGDNTYHLAFFGGNGDFIESVPLGQEDPTAPRLVGGPPTDYRDVRLAIGHRKPEEAQNASRRSHVTPGTPNALRHVVHAGPRAKVGSLLERDRFADGLLDADHPPLTPEHVRAIGAFLAGIPAPESNGLDRLFYRAQQHVRLEQKDFGLFLPGFYELDVFPEEVLDPAVLPHLRALGHIDADRFIQLLRLFEDILPEGERRGTVAGRIVKYYTEKLLHESTETARSLLHDLHYSRDFGPALHSTGSTLVKYDTRVSARDLPRSLRPFLTYLQRDEDELVSEAAAVAPPETARGERMRLSSLIQWKRLHETEAHEGEADVLDLAKKVRSVEHLSREHIEREITHAIQFQALNASDLFIRELIQNAVDIMRETGTPPDERLLRATLSVQGESLEYRFEDPVGMTPQTLINYFLVPGETTKLNGKSIGFFGQGVFTLFANSDEVLVRSGKDDETWYLRMRPIRENGLVVDIDVEMLQSDEPLTGTSVCVRRRSENPLVEAAYLYDSLVTQANALPTDDARIELHGEQVNLPSALLATTEVPGLGAVRVFRNASRTITHRGLYVDEIETLRAYVPTFVLDALRNSGGISLDLPPGVQLTRSRTNIANEDQVRATLHPGIRQCIMLAYIEYIRVAVMENASAFPFRELPYDYFHDQRYDVSSTIRADADRLLAGEGLEHAELYESTSTCVKLLSLLPLFRVGERAMALEEIRNAYHEKSYPFDQKGGLELLPYGIREAIEQSEEKATKRLTPEQKREVVADTPLDALLANPPPQCAAFLAENIDGLRALESLSMELIGLIAGVHGTPPPALRFYSSPENSKAHASRGGGIAWNLKYAKESMQVATSFMTGGETEEYSLHELFGTLAHEYAHTLENHDSWSHNASHEEEQARVLMQFLRGGGMPRLMESMRGMEEEVAA